MKMRKILSLALVTALSLSLLAGCGGKNGTTGGGSSGSTGGTSQGTQPSGDPIVIKFAWGNSRTDTPTPGIQAMAEHIESASNGTMKMEIYYDNTFCESTQILPEMVKGNLEMGGSGATYVAEYMPELGFLNMGYLYESIDHANAVLNGEIGQEMFAHIGETIGQRPLGAYYFGAREVCLTIDREVKSPADLSDIKMRTNGTESMNFLASAMGANPTGISYSEMYTALDTGVVDGQENPISTVVSQKLYEVSKSLTYTDHMIDFSWIAIGEKFWQSLTEDQQNIIMEGVNIACDMNTQATIDVESSAEDLLISEGLSVYHPDITPIREAVLAAYEQKAQTDGWYTDLMQRILDAAP